jgi:RimJ/RimL family protein N-acetyltransferase
MMPDLLRTCYEILGECGMERPPFEEWRRTASENGEVWPIAGVDKGEPLVVGFVLFKGHSIHVAVKPAWRGRWIKPSMLKAWRSKYEHECDLYATPDRFNMPARRLAERLGFRLQYTLGQSAVYVKERTVRAQLEQACLQP